MSTFKTPRIVAASPEEVFAAISHPVRLARWWGPAGFGNIVQVCEFKAGGKWSFVMHGHHTHLDPDFHGPGNGPAHGAHGGPRQ
jgi:uncharacterized protein YndB with AHSA1/START domain